MILQKLFEARSLIKAMELKKEGENKFSHYKYFTPEQINKMVYEAEKTTGLIHIFNLDKTELGVFGYLKIVEVETGQMEVFTQLTAIPDIKATNISQQIGGAVTYTNRYMLMTAFDISDNSLDFDAKDNRESEPAKVAKKEPVIMPDDRFQDMMKGLTKDNAGKWIAAARKNYIFSDDQENILRQWEENLKTE